tara:strand:+ start:2544 stop:2699 length:156 start_codon:yes stop_codon:yes gene_type:complete
MAIEKRLCKCGCGKAKYGTERLKYFNSACEARHRRAKAKYNLVEKQIKESK